MSNSKKEQAVREHYNSGNASAHQGHFDEAEIHYQKAIALAPHYADAHNNLGNIYKEKGSMADAAACYRQAIAINPDHEIACNNLGLVQYELGDLAEAEEHYLRALAINPHYAEAYFNLGNIFTAQKKLDAAIDCYQQALILKPEDASTYINVGNAFGSQDKLDEAEESYLHAIAINPDCAEAHHNLADTFTVQDKPNDAVAHYQRVVALRPTPEAYLNLGNSLARLEKYEAALQSYGHSLSLDPNFAKAHAAQACVYLLLGNFVAGWPKYEWRWRVSAAVPRKWMMPLWDGKDLKGKSILLYCEQGFGDNIQFIRYASMVKRMGGEVSLLGSQQLIRLFESVEGIDHLIADNGIDLPFCDCRIPLLSLPLVFGTNLESIPNSIPYLSVPHEQKSIWAKRLEPYDGLKVGLVWAGYSGVGDINQRTTDRRRSLSLRQFGPLAKTSRHVHFFSLQKGSSADHVREPQSDLKLIDFMEQVDDYADTAGLIANLDLVIGVDTSVIHLAGAMGKPVWVLSRFAGCWRWLLNREDSPWYPTLRLFRQPQSGDWSPVIESVAAALGQLTRK